MKKFFIILFCSLGLITSCNFLDVIPSGKATEQDLFKTHIQADDFAASLYYYMPNRWYFQSSLEMCGGGDMVSSFYGSVYYFPWKAMVFNNLETASNTYTAMWSITCDVASGGQTYNIWGGVRNAYLLLENIDNVPDATEEERNRWRGEAYWIIAYMHHTILEYYGPSYIVDHLIGLQEDINYPRSTYMECAQFISDMYDKAAEFLPEKHASNFVGRATKTTALALKSRLWLQVASPMVNGNSEWYSDFKNQDGTHLMPQEYDKELWKKAMDAAKEAILQGEKDGYTLHAPSQHTDDFDRGYQNYRAAFLGDDSANAFYNVNEHLFCYAAQGNISYNIKNMVPRTGYTSYNREGWRGYFVPTMEAVECFLSKNGLPMHIDPETKDDFANPTRLYEITPGEFTSVLHKNREPRFYASVGFDRGEYDVNGKTIQLKCRRGEEQQNDGNTGNEYQGCTGYYTKKWIHKSNNWDNTAKEFTYHKFAFPYIRFAEPYLDFVEAYVQYYGKIDGEALTYINKVRNRAGLPNFEDSWALVGGLPTGDTLLEAVLRERLSEFVFEGRWYHDLRRYKHVQELLDHKTRSWNLAGTTAEEFYQMTEAHEVDTRTFTAPKNYWMAIPQEQVNINPTLVQNPGF